MKHGDEISEQRTIKRGIIQGENNSQALFSIFINNVLGYIKSCKSILFADDLEVYLECDNNMIDNGIQKINDDMRGIEKFCNDFGVELNPVNSVAIIISYKSNLHKIKYDQLPKIKINNQEIVYVNRTITNDNHS